MSKSRWIVIIVLCVFVSSMIASAATSVLPGSECVVRVQPVGDEIVYLEYGQVYEELGATAVIHAEGKEDTELPVKSEGEVDTAKVGTYQIRYTANYNGLIGTAYRHVCVVDTQPPVITLTADPEGTILPGETYTEAGYSASDDYDGDLTDRVRRIEKNGKVVYTVADTSGNVTVAERVIPYLDPVPPQLTLLGERRMMISSGGVYTEPGYTALDNCDGDITDAVTVSGSVNTNKPGFYTLTYSVSDGYGNVATTTRTVFVNAAGNDRVNDPSKGGKVIYLTFDDGPGPETPRLLDILEKYNVHVTFFVVNTDYIHYIERAAQDGHTVAIHTTTHVFKQIYASEEAFFTDLTTMQGIVEQYTGQKPMLMRFPGGSSNTISRFNKGIMSRLTVAVEEAGFSYFDWNVDSRDAGGAKTPEEVFNNVIRGVEKKDHSVVLMHDIKDYTVDAVEAIILWGLDNGYVFLPLDASSPGCHHDVSN